jgi:hypothetical protein
MLKAVLLQCIQNRNPLQLVKAKQLAVTWAGLARDDGAREAARAIGPGLCEY